MFRMGEQRMWPWKRQILQWKENLFQHFKWKGFKISPPLQTTEKVLKDPQITTFEPFVGFITWGIEFDQKIKFGQEMGNFLLWSKHPFQCCATPNIHRRCENNLRISNLLQTLIIPWIVHRFVKTIQGECVQIGNQEDMGFNSQIWSNHLF